VQIFTALMLITQPIMLKCRRKLKPLTQTNPFLTQLLREGQLRYIMLQCQ